MAELKNRFSWSASRARLFDECLRAYYHNHYGMWGGWSWEAPERARLTYRLKNMSNLILWGGSVVHETIEEALKDYQRAMSSPAAERDRILESLTVDGLKRRGRARMVNGWRESLRGDWQRQPKRALNLFEHYYGAPKEETDARSVEIRDRVFACLEHFRTGGVWDRLVALGTDAWVSIEQLDSFEVDDVLVWVALDLSIREEGALVLMDWKTGTPKEADEQQLRVYGLYAGRMLTDLEAREVHGELHYLMAREQQRMALTPELGEQARLEILESAAKMRELLADPEENVAREEDFPTTSDEWRCARCRFKELCGRQ